MVSFGVLAQEVATPGPVLTTFKMGKSTVAIYKLGDAGSEEAFAQELAPRLREYAAKNESEACASICRNPTTGQWGATMLTIQSHTACPTTSACPEGMKEVGADIHSHIHVSRFRPSMTDRLFLLQDYGPRDYSYTTPEEFSPADKEGGKAYLATPTRLLVYDGKERVIH